MPAMFEIFVSCPTITRSRSLGSPSDPTSDRPFTACSMECRIWLSRFEPLHASDVLCLARQVGVCRMEPHNVHEFAFIQSFSSEIFAVHSTELLEKKIFRQR